MITFTRFELNTPLPVADVKQKLADFIDADRLFKADLAKGYTGEVKDDSFTLRKVYTVERWYQNRKWEKVRIRNRQTAGESYKGYGTLIAQPAGTQLQVAMRLHRSTWIILGLFFLAPFGLAAWLYQPMGQDYFTMLGIAMVFGLGFLLLLFLYHFIVIKRVARTVKRDLEALLTGTWEPLQVGPVLKRTTA